MQPYNYYQPYLQQTQQPYPYMDRLSQLQSQQNLYQQMPVQANNQPQMIGKMVDGIELVKATDIPMDGNMYYFPKADCTEIYGKQWMQDGRTRILTFKPVFDDKEENSAVDLKNTKFDLSEEATEAFMKRFDDLTDRLERMEKSIKPSGRKKEVTVDE